MHKRGVEVITQNNTNGNLTRQFVRNGVAGNLEVVAEMRRVIRNSVSYDIGIERLAKDLLKNAGANSYTSPADQLNTLFRFVLTNVTYIQDKAGLIESIKSARVTLSDGYGDCDDLTNTIATLAGCVGFEDVRIALAKYDNSSVNFVHVYPVVYVQGKRFVLDATLPDAKLNDEVTPTEVREIPIFETIDGYDTGWASVIGEMRHSLSKVGRVAVETLPAATGFLPLGFVGGRAVATASELFAAHAAEQDLSINAVASKINKKLDELIVALIRGEMAYEIARSASVGIGSQLSATTTGRTDEKSYGIIKGSIQTKLNFIKNFPAFAKEHNLDVVHLDPSAMLIVGLAGAAWGGYSLFKKMQKGQVI